MWRQLGLFALVVLVTACGGRAATSPRVDVTLGQERARYTFEDPDTEWDVFSLGGDQAIFRIQGGVLEGAVIADRGYIWSLGRPRYGDAAISATVRQTQGSRGNGFGLMCRANEDGDGYYFVISSAGHFAILKAQPGIDDPARLVDWQSSPAIFQDNEPNHLQAVCAGDYLAFSANGQLLAEVRDAEFANGRFGVVLGAVEETLWVSFDDIVVRDAALVGD